MCSQGKRQDRGWRCVPVFQAADAPLPKKEGTEHGTDPFKYQLDKGSRRAGWREWLALLESGPQAECTVTHSFLKSASTFQTPSVPMTAECPCPSAASRPPPPATSIRAHTASLYPAASHTCSDGSHTSVSLSSPSLVCTSRPRWLCRSMACVPASAFPTLSPHDAALHNQ